MHLVMPYYYLSHGYCCYIGLILLVKFFPLDFPNLDFGDIPMVAVQDLSNILKQGYLEKKRRGKIHACHIGERLWTFVLYML